MICKAGRSVFAFPYVDNTALCLLIHFEEKLAGFSADIYMAASRKDIELLRALFITFLPQGGEGSSFMVWREYLVEIFRQTSWFIKTTGSGKWPVDHPKIWEKYEVVAAK